MQKEAIINNYIRENKHRFINELIELLKIPSVSADPKYSEDVGKAAKVVSVALRKAGAENVKLYKTKGHHIVYGDKIIDLRLPTVLVYGHYDVQPPDPIELWNSPPFEPLIKDGKIYARGASDDKGQMYMHIKAFELLHKNKLQNCNIKFMIEGEEEVGSEHLGDFIKANKELLRANVVLISDTGIIANNVPSITVGLRGLSYVEVEVTGPNRDLHSGIYGGAVANPINILCEMIANMKDKDNRINIPEFYADVEEINPRLRAEMGKAPFSLDKYKKHLNIQEVHGESGFSTNERTSIRPTLDVNGIWGGYTSEGAKTVIPSKAYAKISMRLVPNQSYEKISNLFKNYFEQVAPKSVSVNVKILHGGEPVVVPTDFPGYLAASKAMEKTFGKTPIPTRTGGSIPIVALFEKELGLKSILLGFGLDSDAIHSPNEHYGVFNYLKGIETICWFYHYFNEE